MIEEVLKLGSPVAILAGLLFYIIKVALPKLLAVFRAEMHEERKLCRESMDRLAGQFDSLGIEIKKLVRKH